MTFPAGIETVVVNIGRYTSQAGGTGYKGQVIFTPRSPRHHIATSTPMPATPIVVPLTDGQAQAILVASDATGCDVTDVQYDVVFAIKGPAGDVVAVPPVTIYAAAAGSPMDLDALTGVTPANPTGIAVTGAALDNAVVHIAGNETIAGTKTFTAPPIVPTPTGGTHAATKAYVDANAGGGAAAPDATTTVKGLVRLAGDLAGTATSPTVPALTTKAPLASPALTGTPTAPTAAGATNTTQVATTAFVRSEISALAGTAPATLDTLGEISTALGADPNLTTTLTNAIAAKAPIASPTLTGTPAAPTATAGTSTTQIATTAFVAGAVSDRATDTAVVHLAGTETVSGTKTFTAPPIVPTPSSAGHAANRGYVDSITAGGAPDASTVSKGIVQLTGDLGGTATAPTVPGLAAKAADNVVVKLSGAQAISGVKTFTSPPVVPTPVGGTDAATKGYVDTAVAGVSGGGGSGWNVLVTVTADGTTDAAPTIQAVLDGLTGGSHSTEVIVEGSSKGTVYLNSKVRISTSNTKVRFRNPVLIGTGIDPDGFGGLSIRGTVSGTTTVSSGGTRGSSKVVVASVTGITAGQLVRLYDNDTSGGGSAGYKSEMAEVVDVSGTTLYLDHALYQTYSGTVSLEYLAAVTNSGFEDIAATFSGQQSAAFLFAAKMQYVRNCFLRNCHFRGNRSNSWSRECVNLRYAYRSRVDNCSVSFGWDYTVGSTYDYAFSADCATECVWTGCWASNTRHSFSLDKGSAGCVFDGCTATNVLASGFDLHGNWCTDIRYLGCHADSSVTYSANDGQRVGFLSGNTTFINGVSNVSYTGCTARSFGPYTTNTSGSGDGAGFGVVDGCSNITFEGCKVYDSEMGVYILSQIGQPITNVGIYNCEFSNLNTASPNVPIYINAGVAPEDVNGVIIDGCRFVNGNNMASLRVYGSSTNQLADVVITNCTWNRSTLIAGVHAIDGRYVDNLIIAQNVFSRTNRGIALLNCPSAAVVHNTFRSLLNNTSAKDTILDSGGNTNMVFAKNLIVGYQPTSWGTAISSSGAYVETMNAQQVYATGSRPAADVARVGAWYYDSTAGRPAWSDGTTWTDPLAVTPIDTSAATTYTLALTDTGRAKEFTSSSAITVTLPSDTTAAIPIGATIPIRAMGTGQITTVAGSGATVTNANGLKTASQYATIVAEKRAANAWLISGDATP